MALTTEFVLGTGGSVEEIPVSMSGAGGSSTTPLAFPLTTVDAGTGAWVMVGGTFSGTGTSSNSGIRPHLMLGQLTHEYPYVALQYGGFLATQASGTVEVSILSRYGTVATSFTGTVYVARL